MVAVTMPYCTASPRPFLTPESAMPRQQVNSRWALHTPFFVYCRSQQSTEALWTVGHHQNGTKKPPTDTPGDDLPTANPNRSCPHSPDNTRDQETLNRGTAHKSQLPVTIDLAPLLGLQPLGLLHHQVVAVIVAREDEAIGWAHWVNHCMRQTKA